MVKCTVTFGYLMRGLQTFECEGDTHSEYILCNQNLGICDTIKSNIIDRIKVAWLLGEHIFRLTQSANPLQPFFVSHVKAVAVEMYKYSQVWYVVIISADSHVPSLMS